MHGTAPVLRSVTSALSHSPSRIPHLQFHIVQRRALSLHARQHRSQQIPHQQRCQSTYVHAADIDRNTEDAASRTEVMGHLDSESTARKAHDKAFSSTQKMEQLLKQSNLFEIMQDGIPDRILSGLMSNAIGTPFIRTAPDHLFNKALLALDPGYFIDPYKDVFRHMRRTITHFPLKSFKGIDERLSAFAAYLDHIVAVRRENGKRLDLEACRHLLKWAASMGDERLAESILKMVMPEDGVQPDLESYNYYCKALVWSNAFGAATRYHLRVIPRHLRLRALKSPPEGLVGHQVSNPEMRMKGVRERVLDIFKESTNARQSPDESTFTHLMLAMGREADLEGVKSILKSVWNVDVDLLGVYDEEEIESPTFYEEGHHLHPSDDLLFTVVHIFGSNNDARTAWLLVDFISRNYAIPISERVWNHLFEWAFLLSLRRSQSQKKRGDATGQIMPETFYQMYKIMTDEPHNFEPGFMTHYLLSRSWRDRRHLDNATFHIEELEKIVDAQHLTIKRTAIELMNHIRITSESGHPNIFSTYEFYKIRRQYVMDFLELQCGIQLLQHAVDMNLFRETDWAGSGRMIEWERRVLPRLVKKFTPCLPNAIQYQIRTGNVRLYCKPHRDAVLSQNFRLDYRTATFIYNALDTEDQATLNLRMRMLQDVVRGKSKYCYRCESTEHFSDSCPRLAEEGVELEPQPEPKFDAGEIMTLSREALESSPVAQDVVLSTPVFKDGQKHGHGLSLPFD